MFSGHPRKRGGEGGSGAQKRTPSSSPDAVGAQKKSPTPITSDRSPASAWNEPNRAQLAILAFGMQHAQCQDVNLSPDIRTRPIWRITISQLELMVVGIYKYFDLNLSESHRAKLYICTVLDQRFKKFHMWPTRKYVENSQLYTECK